MTANDRVCRLNHSQRTPRYFDLGVEAAGSGVRESLRPPWPDRRCRCGCTASSCGCRYGGPVHGLRQGRHKGDRSQSVPICRRPADVVIDNRSSGGLITASFTLSGSSAQAITSLLPHLASGYNRTLPLARWHPPAPHGRMRSSDPEDSHCHADPLAPLPERYRAGR